MKDSGIDHLVVLGLNYHSTPLAIRERFIIPAYCLSHALHALAKLPHIKEAAVLSTCNRTEVYAVVSDVNAGLNEIESFFMSTQTIADHGALKPNFKLLREDVALHLFRVASGLDSMVLGEGQIMSQVKEAQRIALETGTAGPVLDQLFKLALNCGKRVRSETSMARRAVSVSSAAVELGREILGSLRDRTTLIIGAGKMAKICAKHVLSEHGKGKVVMINRSPERPQQFAATKLPNPERLQIGLSFDDRYSLAASADLVIVSTSAHEHLLSAQQLAEIQHSRPTCIIDISVPRNVDPEIGALPGYQLYHSDDLAGIVNKNLAEREALVSEAEEIVFEALDGFHDWQRSLIVAPTITDLRKKIEQIRVEHVSRSRGGCPMSEEQVPAQADELSRGLINQILHQPTVQLKSTVDYKLLKQQAETLRTLFNLDIFSESPGKPQPSPASKCPVHH